MNIVIVSGKIVSDVDFEFMYNKDKKQKNTSIAICKIQLNNGNIVDVYGYDDIADYLYRNENMYLWIEGRINSNMKIEVLSVYRIDVKFKYAKIQK